VDATVEEAVEAYLDEVPADRFDSLCRLREACLELLDGFEESMDYGIPSYGRHGEIEVGFASRKHYISLYILRVDVMEAHRHRLAGLDVAKGCIRYRRPEQVDMDVVRSMLAATAATLGPIR
jgi:uncharacterized protein YdhG (YjbR/CyaY superfamily)